MKVTELTTSIMRAVRGAHAVEGDTTDAITIHFNSTKERDAALAELQAAHRRKKKPRH